MTEEWICASCGADWHAEPIPIEHRPAYGGAMFYSLRIAIYDRDAGRTVAWRCPSCGDEVPAHRATNEHSTTKESA